MINIESGLMFDLRMMLQSLESGIELSQCDTATKWLRDVLKQAMEIKGRVMELEDERDFIRRLLESKLNTCWSSLAPMARDYKTTNFDCDDGVQANH